MLKKKRFTAIFLSLMLVVGISGVGMGEMTACAEEMQEAVKTEAEEEAVNGEKELAEQEQVEHIEDDVELSVSESVDNEALDENEADVLQNAKSNVAESDMSERTEKDEIFVEEKKDVFRQVGNAENIFIGDSGADDLPAGVSYDASTNTLTINNAEIGSIFFRRSKDLTVKVFGKNTVGSISMGGVWVDEEESVYACGDIGITGTGTIYAKSFNEGSNFICQGQDENYDEELEQWDLEKNGDIYIDGVTIITDCGLITSHNSNVTIRNAMIQINNGTSDSQMYSKYGITTGRAFWDESFKQEKYGGILTIENSEMEIKYCREILLAWNELNAPGCKFYSGKESPEYQIDLEKICGYNDYGSFKRGVINRINYLKITSKNLELPKAYELIDETASNAKGSISFPDGIYMEGNGKEVCVSGKKVNVTVKPDSGYQLDKLYVNGKAVSGTSFTMPAKDTTVKAEFVKKKVKITGVKIIAPSKRIAAGKKAALGVKVSPAAANNKKVIWSVSNKKYASVNSKGVVTMKKAGAGKTITVTAKAADGSGKKASVKIKVMKGVVKKIKLTAAKSVKAGKKTAVKAKVTASKGANKTLAYSVSNKKYASVNSKGVVTTKKAGKGKRITVTAKATDGSGKKAVVKIKIK